MSFEQWILMIQAIGLPLVGWAIRELRRLIKLLTSTATKVDRIEKKQIEIERRVEALEAA